MKKYVSFFEIITGEQGIDVFNQEAKDRNICIAMGQKVPSDANEETFIKVTILKVSWQFPNCYPNYRSMCILSV